MTALCWRLVTPRTRGVPIQRRLHLGTLVHWKDDKASGEAARGAGRDTFERCRMVQPLQKPKRVKKFGLKKFNRHQHDRKIAVKVGHCYLPFCSHVTLIRTIRDRRL